MQKRINLTSGKLSKHSPVMFGWTPLTDTVSKFDKGVGSPNWTSEGHVTISQTTVKSRGRLAAVVGGNSSFYLNPLVYFGERINQPTSYLFLINEVLSN